MFYLYKITCTVNQKVYIGQTVQPDKRWYQHRHQAANPTQVIAYAIKKHGAENFIFEIIAVCKMQEDANYLEEYLINQYDCLAKNGKGYNISLGGMVAPKTEEWKAHMSKVMTGKSGTYGHLGKNHSEVSKQKISEALTGLPAWNKGLPTEKQPLYGKHLTDEHKAKVGLANRKGRLSDDTVRAIREDYKTLTSKQIAEKYSISVSMASDVAIRQTYKHIQ